MHELNQHAMLLGPGLLAFAANVALVAVCALAIATVSWTFLERRALAFKR